MMPILPKLLRLNLRMMVLSGLACFAASCFLDTPLTAQTSGQDFVWSQLLRGVGQILAFMPLNQASVGAVPREDAADAAGLYNMARNLGGSLGLALLGVFIDRQVATHAASLSASVTANSQAAQAYMASQAVAMATQTGGDVASRQTQAVGSLMATIQQQATILTYSDCFFLLGVGLLAMMPLAFILRRPPPGGAPVEAAH